MPWPRGEAPTAGLGREGWDLGSGDGASLMMQVVVVVSARLGSNHNHLGGSRA